MENNNNIYNVNHLKIQKSDLKAYLNKKYTKRISDIISTYISFTGNFMGFQEYCNEIWKIAQMPMKEKIKFAFDIFDRDNDGRITVEDILYFMKELKPTDWLITDDCHVISKALNK